MEAFLGTWKVESNNDFHKFMHHFGVPSPIAKLVLQFGSTTTFSQKDTDTYNISVASVRGKTEATFRLGEEFEEASSGGTLMKAIMLRNQYFVFFPIKSKIGVEDGVMKHLQVGDGETITTTRTVNGDVMTAVYTVGDLTCSRTYKRVNVPYLAMPYPVACCCRGTDPPTDGRVRRGGGFDNSQRVGQTDTRVEKQQASSS
ncbi:unnamed protein product [Hydatigera taeniaeformis]|uniref:Lipocln_cytosolic_FA-bd_dom domain-containing protein n=1 Tax=Hydatigena taeniaeformis TaxID=6205 RepID=A0A0R3X910_HYDTA|nr:unnamed protein product [Hydatigera taeniaeformis]